MYTPIRTCKMYTVSVFRILAVFTKDPLNLPAKQTSLLEKRYEIYMYITCNYMQDGISSTNAIYTQHHAHKCM